MAEEGIGQTVYNLQKYGSLCGMRWAGSVTVLAETPDDAARHKGLEKRLQRLAKNMVMSAGLQ